MAAQDENEDLPLHEDNTIVSSDESDSDDDDDTEIKLKIQELKTKVNEDPYIYDQQIELLTVLRAAGELEELRTARNNMHDIFPLSPDLWRQWIEDEVKMIGSDDDRDKVTALYDKAVEDYVCPDLWLNYVTFTIGDLNRKGHSYVREVFEKSLIAVGLHVSKGSLIWHAYQEFEVAVLAGLMSPEGKEQTDEEKEAQNSQEKIIISLFKRQLSIPLEDIDQTYSEYKSFVEEIDPNIEASYKKAKDNLKKLKPLEKALENGVAPCCDEYKTYIKHELKAGDPSRIQSIFERALLENYLKPDFWLKYGKYLDQTLQSRTASLKMYQRAVRNCQWSADLWVLHLRAQERFRYREHDVILDQFKKALSCNQLSGATEYLKVWTSYIDYFRRRVDWEQISDEAKRLEDLRTAFQEAIDSLIEGFGQEGDQNCTLLMYQARIEAKFCKNMEKARECWNTIMQQGFGNQAQTWLEYFNLERSFGDHKHCRKILQRAVNSVTDWPEYVVDAFINFEREEGTLEQLEQAEEKCQKQIQIIEERRAQAAEKEFRLSQGKPNTQYAQQKEPRSKARDQRKKQQQPHQPQAKPYIKQSPVVKLSTETESNDGFKIPISPGLVNKPPPPGYKTTTPKRGPPPGYMPPPGNKNDEDGEPPAKKPRAPPPGYKPSADVGDDNMEPPTKKQKENEEEGVVAMETDTTSSSTKSPTKTPEDEASNKCTVFVSNLHYTIKESDLTPIFMPCENLKDIRLIKTSRGCKGYGYVEFKNEFSATAALALDRHEIDKRPMFVSAYKKKDEESVKFKYASEMEKNKLFIRNLPFDTTRESLEKIFSDHGTIKDVRLATYRNGSFKGIAFVEYEDVEVAAKAVFATDGMQVGDHEISVAISNPPPRNIPQKERATATQEAASSYKPSLGGGKKEADRGGRSKTMLSFQPRSLQAKKPVQSKSTAGAAANGKQEKDNTDGNASNADANGSQTSKAATPGLSNSDFRSMLLK